MRNKSLDLLSWIAIGAVFCCLAAGTSAQEAFTVPTSDTLVTLEIQLPQGEWLKASAPEGGLVTVEIDGRTYGFSPQRGPDGTGFQVGHFEITDVLTEERETAGVAKQVRHQRIRHVEDLYLHDPAGVAYVPVTGGLSEIRIAGIAEGGAGQSNTSASPELGVVTGELRSIDRCCVTCGSTTACGCAVQMSCGSCCSGACC